MPKIINWGSLNEDKIYHLEHIPLPGETVSSRSFRSGLGGKGMNQSLAAAGAGAEVIHAGAVGKDDPGLVKMLKDRGVDISLVAVRENEFTGHALILVDSSGNNSIVIHPGANASLNAGDLAGAVGRGGNNDIFLTQNETSLNCEAVSAAKKAGLTTAFNFAPFDRETAEKFPFNDLDILLVNEHEGAGVAGVGGLDAGKKCYREIIEAIHLKYPRLLTVMTLGSEGVICLAPGGEFFQSAAIPVKVAETTAAGDTFCGAFLAALLREPGNLPEALNYANYAAALCVSRPGAAESIPGHDQIIAFMEKK